MTNSLKWAVDIVGLGFAGFNLIAKITRNTTDDKIAEGWAGIQKVIETVEMGATGKASIEACMDAIAEMHKDDADAITSARQRLHDRLAPKPNTDPETTGDG